MNVITFLWFRLFSALHIISRGGAPRVSPPFGHGKGTMAGGMAVFALHGKSIKRLDG